MVYSVRITLDETKMKQIALDRQLEALQESVHRARARTWPKVQAALTPDVGPVKRPIQWTPSKNQNKPPNTQWGYYSAQKAAFFATNGFGRGIPYKRSGLMNEGWTSFSETLTGSGTKITIFNPTTYTQFVVGRWTPSSHMQRFHRNTGWQPILTKQTIIKKILIEGILKEFRWIV